MLFNVGALSDSAPFFIVNRNEDIDNI